MDTDNILESITDGFFALDTTWDFTYVNKIAEGFFGIEREKLLDQNIWSLFPIAVNSLMYQEFMKSMEEQTTRNFIHYGLKTNNIYEARVFPSPKGIGQMAAGIAHEVRNPLTVVRGFLQMMQNTSNTEENTNYFNIIIEEIDRANLIINELMSLGKNKVRSLNKININQVLTTLEPLLITQGLSSEITLNIEKGTIPELILDEKELRQLIFNLVRNGYEAMSKGGMLTIKTYLQGNQVILSVKDDGAGISDEILAKIGTPFFSTKDNGTGLGLAVCYSIIEGYKGKIHYKTSSKGTTFFCHFPTTL